MSRVAWREAPHRAPSRASRGQAGFSLIEVLVVLLVAIPVVLMGAYGLFTAVTASASTKARQELEAGLTSYGESLKALPTYTGCATATQYNTAYDAWADRYSPDADTGLRTDGLAVTDVKYWDQTTASFTSTCGTDGGAQQLTIRDTHQNGDVLEGTVVKRNPAAKP